LSFDLYAKVIYAVTGGKVNMTRLIVLLVALVSLTACTTSPRLAVEFTINGQELKSFGGVSSFPVNQELNVRASFVLPEPDKNFFPIPQELVANPSNYTLYGFMFSTQSLSQPSTSKCGPYPFWGAPTTENVDDCDPSKFPLPITLDQIDPVMSTNHVSAPAEATFDMSTRRFTVNMKFQAHQVDGSLPIAVFEFSFVYFPKGVALTEWKQARRFQGVSAYFNVE
jgi:hypothetical protein